MEKAEGNGIFQSTGNILGKGGTYCQLSMDGFPKVIPQQVQHGFSKDPNHYVDVLPQVCQNLSGVFAKGTS